MLRRARKAGIAALLAACMGHGIAADAEARGAPACLNRFYAHALEDFGTGGDEPYLKVNTKFWEAENVNHGRWITVFRTVHVGDEVQAWEADSPDPDDFIGSDRVERGRGTLVLKGDDAHYKVTYRPGAC